jgi:hypothetical protein
VAAFEDPPHSSLWRLAHQYFAAYPDVRRDDRGGTQLGVLLRFLLAVLN